MEIKSIRNDMMSFCGIIYFGFNFFLQMLSWDYSTGEILVDWSHLRSMKIRNPSSLIKVIKIRYFLFLNNYVVFGVQIKKLKSVFGTHGESSIFLGGGGGGGCGEGNMDYFRIRTDFLPIQSFVWRPI